MDFAAFCYFVGAIAIAGMLSAVLVALFEISDKLTRIAELLVWQVESDDDGEPDGPDDGETVPQERDSKVVPIRFLARIAEEAAR